MYLASQWLGAEGLTLHVVQVFRLWLKEAVVEGTEPLEAEAKSVLHELHNTDYHGLSFNNKVQVLRILCNGVMRTVRERDFAISVSVPRFLNCGATAYPSPRV